MNEKHSARQELDHLIRLRIDRITPMRIFTRIWFTAWFEGLNSMLGVAHSTGTSAMKPFTADEVAWLSMKYGDMAESGLSAAENIREDIAVLLRQREAEAKTALRPVRAKRVKQPVREKETKELNSLNEAAEFLSAHVGRIREFVEAIVDERSSEIRAFEALIYGLNEALSRMKEDGIRGVRPFSERETKTLAHALAQWEKSGRKLIERKRELVFLHMRKNEVLPRTLRGRVRSTALLPRKINTH